MQRAVVRKFSKEVTNTTKQIWSWEDKFEDKGCLCRTTDLDDQLQQKEG